MGRSSLRSLFSLSWAAVVLFSVGAYGDDSCQPVFDALTKIVTTPSHSFTTHTAPFVNGGKPRTSETIFTQGKIYIRVNGKWMPSHATPAEVLEQEKENRQNAKGNCQRVRNELVGTEPAALYSMHSETDGGKQDAQMWISKRTGLALKNEEDVDAGDAATKEHRSTRFEYGNVQPPL
jgi:hypothetical protein